MAPWISWRDDDCEAARDEGWYLCSLGPVNCEIRRLARRKRFANDAAAVRFVRRRARLGSTLHQIAIVTHDFYRHFWNGVHRERARKRSAKKMRCGTGGRRPRHSPRF